MSDVTQSRRRVLVIGLDGGTFDLIEPWAAQGYLPHLARLMADGCHGRLASTLQPTTAPAWVTFMTGVNQGKHGLYDFVRRKAGEYALEVTSARQIAAPTIFERASAAGRHVVAVNIPYTFPPSPVKGVMVGGAFAPAVTRELVFPPSYLEVLNQVAPGYFVLPDYDPHTVDPLASYAERLLEGIELRERLSLHLLRTELWDLFATVFMATDLAQHTFWRFLQADEGSSEGRYRHVIRDVYRRIDQAIGVMLAQVAADDRGRETVVMVMSDHGAGPFYWMINLNRWLAEAGYLRFHEEGVGSLGSVRTAALKRLAYAYRRHVPAGVRALVRARLGARRFDGLKGGFESALLTAPVDWENTQAYSLGAGGNIYINLKGREPAGVIEPGTEYEQVRRGLGEALMSLADPESGSPVVRRVYRREELYHGPFLEQAPDLIIQWTDYGYWGRGAYDSRAPVFDAQRAFDFSTQPLTGSHRPEGILIIQGPGIHSGLKVEDAHLLHLAPTILRLLGFQTPTDMDGQLLRAVFEEEPELLSQAGAEDGPFAPDQEFRYSPEEQEEISRRLRSLGYL